MITFNQSPFHCSYAYDQSDRVESMVMKEIAPIKHQLPPVDDLSPYWTNYFKEVDECIMENFWGNLNIYRETKIQKDPYIAQLEKMGYNFEENREKPAPFYQSLQWIFSELNALISAGRIDENSVIWPGKAFEFIDDSGKAVQLFIPIGGKVPEGASPLNLLTPDTFVRMLSEGFFPISEPIREHTNQSLAEHDLAHMAGFVSSPRFTRSVREAFRRVGVKMKENPKVAAALENFNSAYSLRLYYTIEVFSGIPKENLARLKELIELPLDTQVKRDAIEAFLLKKAEKPIELTRYLSRLYSAFHSLVNPLGGESRDVLNRVRKFRRDFNPDGFYDKDTVMSSKFTRNSIYSLYLNAQDALENRRSNHPNFIETIKEIHTPFVGAILGTSQLEIEDWVLECVEEIPNTHSKLYRYMHDSGLWDESHQLYRAFCSADYDRILN